MADKKYYSKIKSIFFDSLSILLKNKQWWGICAIIDLLLFLILSFFIRPSFFSKSLDYLYAIQGVLSKFSMEYSTAETTGIFTLLSQSGALKYVFWLILTLLLWLFVLYFLFSFFNSLNWFIINKKMLGKKINLVDYSNYFFKISIPWLIFYGIFNMLTYLFSFGMTTINRSETVLNAPWFFSLIYVIAIYFAFISYALITETEQIKNPFRKAFSLGIKKIKIFFPIYIIIILGYFLVDFIMKLLGLAGPLFLIIGGIILLFPSLTIIRILFQNSINNILKKSKKS